MKEIKASSLFRAVASIALAGVAAGWLYVLPEPSMTQGLIGGGTVGLGLGAGLAILINAAVMTLKE